ncbi:YihY/virulence factor BrkB family protein [Microbacterium caowuchunii]|uniref:YihY/virulence factor BrkB family protein n=1 Tax=Microbacterium caowuchunii TaxID=2614638 RepID=A0A5N0TLA8_9MICO|nr:YihY/virulence factor BrkB family protein [Microbacterium caowuchunii]KAA9135935.1 YihY/virulence factor BrkB family protein [Microbacterium caowuchunii]
MPEPAATTAPPPRGIVPRLIAWALERTLVRAFLLYAEHRGPQLADSVTYRTLFSVFAGVLLGFSVGALWLSGNPQAWDAIIAAVDAAIPGLVGEDGLVDPSAVEAPASLTVAGVISLVGLVGAAIGAIGSLRLALRTLADRLADDVLFIWVILRNLALAIAIGALLALSATMSFLGTASISTVTDWLGIEQRSPIVEGATWAVSVLVIFALDTAVIMLLFRSLAGLRPPAKALWTGALLGGVGLTVLQQLSGLFVGGASANPLLASFASLIALLLWFNLSAQVILIASAVIITITREHEDRVRARFGARTFAQRRLRRAEDTVSSAVAELEQARALEEKERLGAAEGK